MPHYQNIQQVNKIWHAYQGRQADYEHDICGVYGPEYLKAFPPVTDRGWFVKFWDALLMAEQGGTLQQFLAMLKKHA